MVIKASIRPRYELKSFSIGQTQVCPLYVSLAAINTSRQGQNGRHFANDIFKHIFLNENFRISIKNSLMFVRKV